MPETNESRLDVQVGSRHLGGRPYHFPSLNQDDRIRKIFGLSEESPLPLVRQETLTVYFDYLMAHLSLPFEALYCQNGGEMRQLIYYVHVMELVDPQRSRNHSLHGLLCKAKNHETCWSCPWPSSACARTTPTAS